MVTRTPEMSAPRISTAEGMLRRAVRAMAARGPITQVSVSDLCREAGVTRDTFYRLTSSPVALLATALDADHDTSAVTPRVEEPPTDAPTLRAATEVLVRHVQRNQAIYRNALNPRLPAEIRDVLQSRLESVLAPRAQVFRAEIPDVGDARPTDADLETLVHFQAAGVVGALEHLVRTDRIDDTDHCIDLFLAAIHFTWHTEP